MRQAPIVKDVFLIGGGHSHVLLIRQWAMRPIAGVRLTLISTDVQTPYSGMLPGLVAGHYDSDDIHIDLLQLCTWAQVRFIEATVCALDLSKKQVKLVDRPAMSFDLLSLDTGSTPDLSVTGADQFVTPVKPVSNFYARWQALIARVNSNDADEFSIGVVGSGAGGFELVTAMRHALPMKHVKFYWFLRNDQALRGRPAKVGQLAMSAALAAGIQVVKNCDVKLVESKLIVAWDGSEFPLDEILWCTAASGPAWLREAGLSVDKQGFVSTNAYLQSISHPFVFATGDVGTQVDTPSSKAGVFAVRQAPVLYTNLRRLILNEPLKVYKPQTDFLSLMATGGKRAIASRGPLAIKADWVWRWKDHIDQTFMRQFRQLPKRRMSTSFGLLPNALHKSMLSPDDASQWPVLNSDYYCRGCGAKVGQDILQRVIASTQSAKQHERNTDLYPASDAAVLKLDTALLAQSVDQINSIVDDPYIFGQIASLHAISDVITLEADLHSAQVLLTLPYADEKVLERDLTQLMKGIITVLDEQDCALLGGHTVQGTEMSLGLVVNATIADSDSTVENNMQPGDALILTKPLGNGTLFAGLMGGLAQGRDVMNAISQMQTSNLPAATVLRQYQCRKMTDVTGFGLLVHLQQLLGQDSSGVQLSISSVPLLDGAVSLAKQGCRSTLWPQNSKALAGISWHEHVDLNALSLLCDPQTSGGMLAVVAAGDAQACIQALNIAGCAHAAIIGSIDSESGIIVNP